MGKADSPEGGKRRSKGRMSYMKQRGGRGSSWGQDGGYRGRGGYRGGGGRGGGQQQQRSNKRPRAELTAGMKGFICSTNFRESDAVREAYNLLNEYYIPTPGDEGEEGGQGQSQQGTQEMEIDALSQEGSKDDIKVELKTEDSQEVPVVAAAAARPRDDDDDELDVDEALKKEIAELKSDRVKYRFKCVDSGVKNVVFITSTVQDPNEIAYRIFEDVISKKEAKARHILRFLPITATCHADMNSISKTCKKAFEKDFKEGYNSFKIIVNVRNNNHMSKKEIITTMANVVTEVNPLNFVDLNNPVYTITAEVLQTVFCVSIVKDFFRFKKFNLVEAGMPEGAKDAEDKPETSEEDKVSVKEELKTEETGATTDQVKVQTEEITDQVKVEEVQTEDAKSDVPLTD